MLMGEMLIGIRCFDERSVLLELGPKTVTGALTMTPAPRVSDHGGLTGGLRSEGPSSNSN